MMYDEISNIINIKNKSRYIEEGSGVKYKNDTVVMK